MIRKNGKLPQLPFLKQARHFSGTLSCCAAALVLGIATVAGCSGNSSGSGGGTQPPAQHAATPTIATTAAQNGAVIVTLGDATSGATIYYTIDGTTPATTSPQYLAPFLVASNLTLNAIATAPSYLNSTVATQTFSPNIASGTLVWSDEFTNTGTDHRPAQPHHLDLRHRHRLLRQQRTRDLLRLGIHHRPLQSLKSQRIRRRYRRLSPHRRAEPLGHRLHLRPPQIPGPLQLSSTAASRRA